MKKTITVSIVTATWNCASTLQDCLDSVAQQTYVNREHVIVDGASSDGTIEIINEHISQVSVFISEPDKGIYDALNKGIQLATGDVVGFLHADDLYASSDALEKIAKAFENPSVCAVYGDLEYVSRQDISKVVRRWESNAFDRKDLNWGWMAPHPTLYVRREWYSAMGGFDTNYRIAADYLMILRLFSREDFKTSYLPKVLVKMRAGGISNRSIDTICQKMLEDWRALSTCKFSAADAAWAIFCKNISKLTQFVS